MTGLRNQARSREASGPGVVEAELWARRKEVEMIQLEKQKKHVKLQGETEWK
jgi:hypothetical protein